MKKHHANLRRCCLDAAALCTSLAISYLEGILPLGMLVSLPGIKPGFANIVITLMFVSVSPLDAAAVSFCRVLIMGMLFGSPISLFISFCGAAAAFGGLFSVYISRKKLSFVGISVICAALHALGQLVGASVFAGRGVLGYLPVMLLGAAATGSVNGALLDLSFSRIESVIKKYLARER